MRSLTRRVARGLAVRCPVCQEAHLTREDTMTATEKLLDRAPELRELLDVLPQRDRAQDWGSEQLWQLADWLHRHGLAHLRGADGCACTCGDPDGCDGDAEPRDCPCGYRAIDADDMAEHRSNNAHCRNCGALAVEHLAWCGTK
jgi:hypothetical protein